MRVITEEQVASCLFGMGFDVIDEFLIHFTVEKLLDNSEEISRCQYTTEFSEFFCTYVVSDDGNFKYRSSKMRIKSEYSLYLTNIGKDDIPLLLMEAFAKRNPELMKAVRQIDFREIMINKIHRLGWTYGLDDFAAQFCKKEKEILIDMFGIEPIILDNLKGNKETNKDKQFIKK